MDARKTEMSIWKKHVKHKINQKTDEELREKCKRSQRKQDSYANEWI